MRITAHDVYESGQRIGWCARPLHDLGPFGHHEVHALVTDTAIEHVRLGESWLVPHARVDDLPRLRELWRSREVEWIDRSLFVEVDEDEDDDLELVVHPCPRRVGPAEERAQLLDSQGRLLASAVRLPAGTEALVSRRVADIAPSGIDRRALERIARRRRVPGDWISVDRHAVAFLCEVLAVARASSAEP